MQSIVQVPALLGGLLDPRSLINHFGDYALWGAALIVFIECWLFPFLPGDSLMFTVGLLISGGTITPPLWQACLVLSVVAVASNVVGYWVGRRAGPAIFSNPNSRIFRPQYVDRTHAFFDRYGNPAVLLGRFVPIVRTLITLAAGVGKMPFGRFIGYSAVGGVAWATGVTLLGYWLGKIAAVRSHIELILVGLVVLSIVPIVLETVRSRRTARSGRSDPSGRSDRPSTHP